MSILCRGVAIAAMFTPYSLPVVHMHTVAIIGPATPLTLLGGTYSCYRPSWVPSYPSGGSLLILAIIAAQTRYSVRSRAIGCGHLPFPEAEAKEAHGGGGRASDTNHVQLSSTIGE
ncbi:hypothetical protein BZA05DRAFT_205220 [Tricharina praecox]|uniref:uncharacterized protein n=1 Tax=Tricharina praecox TaxID=43433 RepID=UPI00221F7D62|nr:uncharacterized protein BZA05DRAFT_231708 [Tricharina praecox]XP_051335053.1 uncharacterized protein BZA05DRAFT_205220 [Tricharina praecox]KAI5840928.1 hypothetical protein BZA05DRAFT_231708 [Tricharina praecox]KAI5842281.1 hypothetical protein BZA05DRAFT_205220 [Tricharina praecox]